MDQKLSMEINGREVHFLQGQTILEVCRETEIFIPTMCCEASGNCDLQEMAYLYGDSLENFPGEKWDLPKKKTIHSSLLNPINVSYVAAAQGFVTK